MRYKALGFSAVFAALLFTCVPLFAHHGGAAYDQFKTLSLKATITDFKFMNPHSQIYFDAADDQGNVIHWSCETLDPAMLSRQGWTRNILKPGDHVTIVGHPAKSGVKIMLLQELILADGTHLGTTYLY